MAHATIVTTVACCLRFDARRKISLERRADLVGGRGICVGFLLSVLLRAVQVAV